MLIQNFKNNFSQCLNLFHQEIARSSDLLTLISPLYGLNDFQVYESWKLSSDIRYYEASNLIYVLKNTEGLPEDLPLLADAFVQAGFEALYSPDFDPEIVKKQIMLIYMIVRGESGPIMEIR